MYWLWDTMKAYEAEQVAYPILLNSELGKNITYIASYMNTYSFWSDENQKVLFLNKLF